MGAGSLLCSDVFPLSTALGWRTASPWSSPPPAYHFRAPCSFLCWACDNSTSCCNLPDNSQSVLLNLSFYLLWLLVSVCYPGWGGLLLTLRHPLVDLLNLSLLQYVRMPLIWMCLLPFSFVWVKSRICPTPQLFRLPALGWAITIRRIPTCQIPSKPRWPAIQWMLFGEKKSVVSDNTTSSGCSRGCSKLPSEVRRNSSIYVQTEMSLSVGQLSLCE